MRLLFMRLLSPSSFSSVVTLSLFALAGNTVVHAQGLTLGAPASSPANSGSGTISGSGTTVTGNYTFDGGADTTTKAYNTVTALGAGSAASIVTLQTGGSIASLMIGDDSQAIISGGSAGTLTTGGASSPGLFNKSGFSIMGGTVSSANNRREYGSASISGGLLTVSILSLTTEIF